MDGVDERTPVDFLEPVEEDNLYRTAAIAYLRVMSLATTYILNSNNPRIATYGVAFALGLTSVVGGKSMRDIGKELNLSSGTISYHAKQFCKIAELPPSILMKQ